MATRQLDDAKLPLSTGKSVWICSNTRAEKELNKLLQEGDPRSKAWQRTLGWIPLGVAGGDWQPKARFSKGQQRQNRLVQLAPMQSAKTKASKVCLELRSMDMWRWGLPRRGLSWYATNMLQCWEG